MSRAFPVGFSGGKPWDVTMEDFGMFNDYPLVNIQKTMENHHA